jgi:Fe-S-cluster containining protein
VSCHWSETEPALGGVTPAALAAKLTPHHAVMRGTEYRPRRCVALAGEIGHNVSCEVYAQRPSACRELQPSWSEGVRDERCDRARAAHGLPPLEPADYVQSRRS